MKRRRTGPRREPLWPAGIVGSITHCRGYRAAAVARRDDLAALGIDAEPDGPLPDGVEPSLTLPAERLRLRRLEAEAPGPHWGRVLFSAKESIYKAWYPVTGRWLGFEEAELTIDPAAGTFHARLLADGGPLLSAVDGRFVVARGLVVTAVAIAR